MKILKKWVTEHQQRGGDKVYTAHALILYWFLFIPWVKMESVCQIFGEYSLHSCTGHNLFDPHEFKSELLALQALNNQLFIKIQNHQARKDAEIVSSKKIFFKP